jgi:signal transduction histidine kinase/GAF domain-containing protein
MILDEPTTPGLPTLRETEPAPNPAQMLPRGDMQVGLEAFAGVAANPPRSQADSLQLIATAAASIARATTTDACAAALLDAIERGMRPASTQISWSAGRLLAHSGPSGSLPKLPDHPTTMLLQSGQLAMAEATEAQVVWAPLMVRGALHGWIWVDAPAIWGDQQHALLTTLAGQAAAALLAIETTTRQHEQLAQIESLTTIGQHISGTLDLDELLEAIYIAAHRSVEADHFFISLYESATGVFEVVYHMVHGQRRPVRDRYAARTSLTGVIVRERRPIWTESYASECARHGLVPQAIDDESLSGAWLGVPLIARDQLVGVLVVTSTTRGHQYREEHVDLLMAIASQAAVAIENARLYRRSEQQARQLETLNQIGRTITSWLDFEQVPSAIMDQVTNLLGAEEGSLLLTDEESGELVFAYTIGPIGSQLRGQRLPANTGIAGYVVTRGQSVIVNDVQHDGRFYPNTDRSTGYTTRRLLAVPLRGVGGIIGVIEVLNRRDNSPFTDEDRRLLEALADYAVIAIENSRRFAQIDQALARRAQELARTNDLLQHNLRSLTALNALGMAINSTLLSPDEVYRMTSHGVVEMTGAIGAWIFQRQGDAWRTQVIVGPPLAEDSAMIELLRRSSDAGRPDLITRGLPAAATRVGARAIMIVPLRASRATLGCLVVGYAEMLPEAPDRETVALFATQAATAVESMELFSAVSSARDQMASILASTREGMMLIMPDRRIAVANSRLRDLCALDQPAMATGASIEDFFDGWARAASFAADEWQPMSAGLYDVLGGMELLVTGELTDLRGRVLEWAILRALTSGDSSGGALLVLRDITDAKESERLRNDLTHMIVHDLRSPLSSVMASVDMLIRGITGDLNGSQQHVLSIANESSQQMLEMINTLLDISKLEAGRMTLDRSEVDISALVQRAADQLGSLAHERKISIQTSCDSTIPLISADPGLIIRVIQNLIANAIKFSWRGAVVSVSAIPTEHGLRVSVRDRGIGIAPRDREKIFTKFGQVGERRGGTGLGLNFCKLVVETHGGRIWVDSQVHEGSTFSFELPLQPSGETS